VVISSLYVFGADLMDGIYDGGIREMYSYMYPKGGSAEAYAVAGDSFRESGFLDEAAEAWELALECAAKPEYTPRRKGATKHVARLRERVAADLEALRLDPAFANGNGNGNGA
ncbi:MAG: hypothetical protein ACYTG4_03595, partial [Planctomycetota bacterium]